VNGRTSVNHVRTVPGLDITPILGHRARTQVECPIPFEDDDHVPRDTALLEDAVPGAALDYVALAECADRVSLAEAIEGGELIFRELAERILDLADVGPRLHEPLAHHVAAVRDESIETCGDSRVVAEVLGDRGVRFADAAKIRDVLRHRGDRNQVARRRESIALAIG
jgi:hypothetical protein